MCIPSNLDALYPLCFPSDALPRFDIGQFKMTLFIQYVVRILRATSSFIPDGREAGLHIVAEDNNELSELRGGLDPSLPVRPSSDQTLEARLQLCMLHMIIK